MLAAAQANIPPELRQCLEVVPGSVKPLNLSNFSKQNDGKPIIKFLSYPSGLATDYQAVFGGNTLAVKRINQQATVYNFALPEGVEIVDVEYLQTASGRFGLSVLYNDGDNGYLARLVHGGEKLKPVHETIIPFPGSCLKVVMDDVGIVEGSAFLNARMQQWCNIVVVGTQFGHAYVFYLPDNPYWTHDSPPETRKLADALSSYHRTKKFVYNVEGRLDVVKEATEVRVTSIAYISRSCDLLIGLSFGGIVQVGLTPTGDIVSNVFQCSSPVCHMVPMLPHDDPNMNVWFWAFHGERGKTVVMVLYEGSYRVIGQENVATRDREFRKALFYPKMADQVAGKGTRAEWISAHCLVRERKLDDIKEERMNELQGHNATLNDTDLDTSQMFFSYIDARGTLKFGIFDLNTYYFKRLNARPTPDSTAAKQCPYLTDVALLSSDLKALNNITDIIVDCSYVTRFQFMAEDTEHQIYASGLNLNRIYVGSSTATATFQLRSLPSQVLERIYEKLDSYTTNWREAALGLLSVGLMPLPLEINVSSQATSALLYGHTSYEMVMTAAILYGYTESVVELIKATKPEDWSSIRVKCEWMWSEVQKARNKLDMLNDVLFSDAAKELLVDQKRQFCQLNAVLRSAKWIYRTAQEKYIQWVKSEIVPRILMIEIESQLAAVNNVSDFANCIRNLYMMKYLPLGERNTEERQILEDMVHERRSKLRDLSMQRSLHIDEIVAKMQQIEPNEPFWLDQEGEEWYPPAVHNAVTPLLKATYHHRMKQEFIIYYMIDLVMAKKILQLPNKTPDMRKIIFHVKEILSDVLGIGEKEITVVFNRWHREQQLLVKETSVEEPLGSSVAENLEEKINSLAKKAEQLTVGEENDLKLMCNKIPYGQFRYQLYLIERSRFNDVEILTLPNNVSNYHVDLYAKALPAIRRVKKFLEPLKRVNIGPSWPQEVVQKFKQFEPSQKAAVIQVKKETAGVSVPLYKRIHKPLKAATEPEEVEVCQEHDVFTTPESRNYRERSDGEVTPRMNELDEKMKQKINSILRTPTSRRARAAAAAEGQTGVQVTPETQVFLPAPTSILKTPVRRNISPSRGIRWDPEFVSIDNTTLSATTDSPMDTPILTAAVTPALRRMREAFGTSSDSSDNEPTETDSTMLGSPSKSPENSPDKRSVSGRAPPKSEQESSISKSIEVANMMLGPASISPKETPILTPAVSPKMKRARRSISETADIGASPVYVVFEPRRSARKRPAPRVLSEAATPKSPKRRARASSATATVSLTTVTPSRRTRIRTSETQEDPLEMSSSRSCTKTVSESKKKSPARRALLAVFEESATVEQKSPSRSTRSRSRTVSETQMVQKVHIETRSTHSCSKSGTPSEAKKVKSRRALAAVFEETTEEPKSPSRRRARTPSATREDPISEVQTTTRSGRKVVSTSQSDPMLLKSPSRRTKASVSEETVEPKSPARKRVRQTKNPTSTGLSLVEQFRVKLAQRTAGAKTSRNDPTT